ncbi:MAG TPA: hypothetical protein VLC79_16115 [Cellvibrio sp.]|nr:hypothetical protein [Cellvibrio sp.]
MTKKNLVITLIFSCFALNACAKTENTNTASQTVKDQKTLFATRTPIANDQKMDIDGDGRPDVAEVVTIAETTQTLPSTITLITPWVLNGEATASSNPLKGGSHNNLLVTLGTSKQYLIHDVNDISILDTDAAKEITVTSKSSLEELDLSDLGEQAKGDVIVIPTEAGIDTYLYWNGSSFQTYEPMESP